jgi:hypothetical protein
MKPEQLHGISLNRVAGIRPILESWTKLMRTLASEWAHESLGNQRDCPWWYLERTSVGFLSGAVWNQGGRAVEEYGTDKKSLTIKRNKKQKRRLGRGDLMFSVKSKSSERWFVAEAKQNHPPLNGKYKTLHNLVTRRLRAARKDAARCRGFGCSRLGLLFLCPYVPHRPPKLCEIHDWIRSVKRIAKSKNAAVAWSFPSVARTLSDDDAKKRIDYYPGVALFVRHPRRP